MSAGRTKLIRFLSKAQKERIERFARKEKRSLNQFILLAIEERALRMAQAESVEARQSAGLTDAEVTR